MIAGGGAGEAECALRLTQWSKTLSGVRSYCVRAFAEVCVACRCSVALVTLNVSVLALIFILTCYTHTQALEIIPYTLAENAGMNPIRIVTELRNRHNQGDSSSGIDVRRGSITDMWDEHVVQPLLVNLSEISLATECVGMILKIDDLIPVR